MKYCIRNGPTGLETFVHRRRNMVTSSPCYRQRPLGTQSNVLLAPPGPEIPAGGLAKQTGLYEEGTGTFRCVFILVSRQECEQGPKEVGWIGGQERRYLTLTPFLFQGHIALERPGCAQEISSTFCTLPGSLPARSASPKRQTIIECM